MSFANSLRGPLEVKLSDGVPTLLHTIPIDTKEKFPFKVEPVKEESRTGVSDITHHKVSMEFPMDEYVPADLTDLNTTEKVEVKVLNKNKTVTLDKSNAAVMDMVVYTSLEGPEPKLHVEATVVTTDGDWTAALPVT